MNESKLDIYDVKLVNVYNGVGTKFTGHYTMKLGYIV